VKIPEILFVFSPQKEEAESVIGFQYAGDEIGKRSKLGGEPDWIQGDEIPKCSCRKKMSFYGQLDSIGDSVCLADCGLIYVFVCLDCLETKSVLQSY